MTQQPAQAPLVAEALRERIQKALTIFRVGGTVGHRLRNDVDELARQLEQAEREKEQARIEAVQGVMDLMQSVGTLNIERDAIVPHSNGYSCWFIGYDPKPTSTRGLTAEEIVRRIDAREALSEQNTKPSGEVGEEA